MRKRVLIVGCLLLGAGLAGVVQGQAQAQAGKLVVIVEENQTYGSIVGNSQAPYLNQLIAQGELFTNYTAVASSSTPNYLAMTSGLTSSLSPPSPNIFQAIDRTGGALRWTEFMESAPGDCAQGINASVPGTSVPLYTASHDPAYQYRAGITCSTNDVPMTASTFDPANLPDLSYIVPNQCDDMHTLPGSGQACPAYFGPNPGTSVISMGDNWLATVVPQLLAQPNVTVMITWDEGRLSTTPPEHIAALAAGAGVMAGSSDGTAYTQYSLEAGLYDYFGLGPAPNNGAAATPLPLSAPAPAPSPSSTSPSTSPSPSPTATSPSPAPTTSSPSPTPTPTSPSPSPTATACPSSITVDPSSPAVVHSGYGASSLSTASFSPPAGSLLEVIVNALQAAPGGNTVTVTDSNGDTFTTGPHIAGTQAPNSSWFFQLYETSAPGSTTVTAHQAGSNAGTLQLAVHVLTGAAPSQAGAASGTYDGTTPASSETYDLASTQPGSWLYVAAGNGDEGATLTPVSGELNVDVWNDAHSGNDGAIGRLTTTGTGSQVLGWTASSSDPFEWAAQEVLHC